MKIKAMAKKKKPDIISYAQRFAGIKFYEENKVIVFIPKVNRLEFHIELWMGKNKKYKINFMKNIYLYYVTSGQLKKNSELNFFNIETKEIIARVQNDHVKFF